MSGKPEVRVRRVYDEPSGDDGVRVLVDRVWPRGLSKQKAHVDQWCKQVAPSTELRNGTVTSPPGSRSSPTGTAASSSGPSRARRWPASGTLPGSGR